ncbi:MAG: type IV toxin-antitoxin system AbiEi family antitoxin domain-containing protein [Egibacteraceae bacterium]
MRGLPRAITELMSRQYGVIERQQLLTLGPPPTAVKRWVTDGVLIPLHRGVYGLAGATPSHEQHIVAALLRAGPEARAGGPSACWLHGIEGVSPDWPPYMLVPEARRVRHVSFTVVRSGWAARDEQTVRGIPAVSPALGLIDLAALVTERRLRIAVDDARRQGLIRLDRLVERAEELRRRPGAVALRHVFASGQFAQESEGERLMARLFRPGDPQPSWAVWVYPDVRVDAIFLEARLVLEYDGRDHHTIDTDRDADSRRELRLKHDQIEVLRITYGMLREMQGQTRAMVLRIYRQRLALGLPPVVPAR